MKNLAPIVLFTYKRLDTLKKTVEALSADSLSGVSDLIVYSDGPKSTNDEATITEVRAYLKTITSFRTITILESKMNKGLANSVIEGVTEVINQYGKVIVLEDDLVVSSNFLIFMNEALEFYEQNQKVFSVSGYGPTIKIPKNYEYDVYFTSRSSSWGWATWKNRWESIDWGVNDYSEFKKNRLLRRDFNKMGSDMSQMLDRQIKGKINSWAIRWCYHQFKYNLFSVHPFASKIVNIGFNSPDASNTKEKFNRYQTLLDTSFEKKFHFTNEPYLDPKIIKQFTKPFSIATRIQYKIINSLFKN